ncbi:MAG: HAD-IG family 5'-nucleotidase [Planctomycetota bacterium]
MAGRLRGRAGASRRRTRYKERMNAEAEPFSPPPGRGLFCNRTLNMRSIRAIGFDMDYTLVHYRVQEWEKRAFEHARSRLLDLGHPVFGIRFCASWFARGLILDLELGNIVKANRFGRVHRASHGVELLPHEQMRRVYGQVWIDLADERWVFLNTLFSLSEACVYAQMVDLLDRGALSRDLDYRALHGIVSDALNAAHLEGQLKAEIVADPERFVELDEDLPVALSDLKQAGKRLFLATNSEWHYAEPIMGHAFDRFLGGGKWRDLFDLVIVQTRKPGFFEGNAPFELMEDTGRWAPCPDRLPEGGILRGGNAGLVQRRFGAEGEEVLYVGDHVYADVHVSSRIRRWRTVLVLRELEAEIAAEQEFADDQRRLREAMRRKDALDREQAGLRLCLQRLEHGMPPPAAAHLDPPSIHERLRAIRAEAEAIDAKIAPLAKRASELGNARWGPLMRAGNDKSRLARQIERHADVYTSRVSNLLYLTPFGYLRAARGSLPHDADRGPAS